MRRRGLFFLGGAYRMPMLTSLSFQTPSMHIPKAALAVSGIAILGIALFAAMQFFPTGNLRGSVMPAATLPVCECDAYYQTEAGSFFCGRVYAYGVNYPCSRCGSHVYH